MRSTAIRQRNVFIVLLCIGIASRAPAKSPIDDNPILTEAECHDFAERLTRAVEKGNVRDCSELFNESGIVDRFFEGIDFGTNNREQTIAQWKQGFLANHVLFQPLITNCATGGTFRLASATPTSAQGQLVMRALSPQAQ